MKDKTIQACDHIGIFTNHPDKLMHFYINKLGFSKEKESLIPKSVIKKIFAINDDCRIIRLALKNFKIELFCPLKISLKKADPPLAGYNHFGLASGARERFYRKLRRKKVRIITVRRNAHNLYFIKDPDANLIEIRD